MIELTRRDLVLRRLYRQQIAAPRLRTPAEVVAALGAMQAQDYPGTLWAVGLRTVAATVSDVEGAVASRSIVRTWPLRGTLHIAPAADIRWMLALSAPRTIAAAAGRYRQLELDQRTFARANAVFAKALSGGHQMTRQELALVLELARIGTAGQRLAHLLQRGALEQVICFGARRGKQFTYALLDDWVAAAPTLDRDEGLGRLAHRYFGGHGPATVADFAWWSGQTLTDARRGVAQLGAQLGTAGYQGATHYFPADDPPGSEASGALHLLPGFDEFLLGYQDRSAALDWEFAALVCPGGNGMFAPTIVQGGRVIGTWTRPATTAGPVSPRYFRSSARVAASHLNAKVARYAAFLDRPLGDRVDSGGSTE